MERTRTFQHMGRKYTGADFTTTAPRLNLSDLLRVGYFTKDATCSGGWSWSNGDRVEIVTQRKPSGTFMDLTTHFTDYAGEAHVERQRIYLYSVPSNLGRGKVLYFRCPFTHRPCRILYRAYHSRTWRSREGFGHRLYYPQQAESGWGLNIQRERSVEAKLEALYSKRTRSTYRGRPTRQALRIAKLEAKLEAAQDAAWDPANLPPRIREAVAEVLGLDK